MAVLVKIVIFGIVVVIVILVVAARRGGSAGCAYPGRGDPIDPANRPPTPATPGFPHGIGFRGEWVTAFNPLQALSQYDFVWNSYWLDAGGSKNGALADGRALIFRLEGSSHVEIVGISPQGVVAADQRSAYGCCDKDGAITVHLSVEPGVAPGGENGRLWGIDPPANTGGPSFGATADFEVVPFR
jgi:hypothetical protein